MLTADVPLTGMPQRITVAGGSGTGKTTLCNRIAELVGYPRVEIDSLHHGPKWTRRESFVADVERYTSGPQWVIELQYREVRPLLLERADTLLWLDYPTSVQMTRLMRRTLRRRLLRQELWNGNQEPRCVPSSPMRSTSCGGAGEPGTSSSRSFPPWKTISRH